MDEASLKLAAMKEAERRMRQATEAPKFERRWGEPRYLTIGCTFTPPVRIPRVWRKGEDRSPETTENPKRYYPGGQRVDVVRPWSLVKAIYRHNTWAKKRNNEFLKIIASSVLTHPAFLTAIPHGGEQ